MASWVPRMTGACPLPWCVEHNCPEPGITVHRSRALTTDPVPVRLSRYDDNNRPGRVQIEVGDAWLTPAKARRLARALLAAAATAEHS